MVNCEKCLWQQVSICGIFEPSKKQMKMHSPTEYTSNQNKHPSKISGSEKWLNRLNEIIEKDPTSNTLNNESLATALKVSERDLFRKVKKMTGLSPQKYLRKYRLKQAMKFLIIGQYRTVKETAHAIGYSKVSYFIAQFEKAYGKTPFKVLQENGWR